MKFKKIAVIQGGQDGAIYGNYLFRFDHTGKCYVYDVCSLNNSNGSKCDFAYTFTLDKADITAPHSNSVMFGNTFYSPEDKFPLLYTNVYNNYSKTDFPRKGMTMVYRIFKNDGGFSSELVQIIEIGFTNDFLWASANIADRRPYGNFVLDKENDVYYAFTMHDESETTKYFSFDLPNVSDGIADELHGVKRVILDSSCIKTQFSDEIHRFMQGAVCYNGIIYSLEGFTDNSDNPPAIRIVDPGKQKQLEYISLADSGYNIEPEFIDFCGGVCYYADYEGNLYTITF